MKKKRVEEPKRPEHLHRVEKILGMGDAYVLIWKYSIFAVGGPGKYTDEKAEEVRRKGVEKIAELWDLSESAKRVLIRKWVEVKRQEVRDGESGLPVELQGLFRPIAAYVPRDESEDIETELLLGDKEENIPNFNKLQAELARKKVVLSVSRKVKKGHFYLDVTELDRKAFRKAYGAVLLSRNLLGMVKRDMKRGAPKFIDERRALIAGEAARRGVSRETIAKALDFKVYRRSNPFGSSPLEYKYIKAGQEIGDKLDKLERYLNKITGMKV